MATAVRGKKGRKGSVLVKAIEQCDDDGQAAAVQYVGAEHSVLTAKHKKSNQDPKGRITLRKAIHIKPPMFHRRIYVVVLKRPAAFCF